MEQEWREAIMAESIAGWADNALVSHRWIVCLAGQSRRLDRSPKTGRRSEIILLTGIPK